MMMPLLLLLLPAQLLLATFEVPPRLGSRRGLAPDERGQPCHLGADVGCKLWVQRRGRGEEGERARAMGKTGGQRMTRLHAQAVL